MHIKNEQTTAARTDDRPLFGRREFVRKTAVVGAGLASGSLSLAGRSDARTEERPHASILGGGSAMRTRKLGQLEVSELGSGAMSISANYGTPADRAQGIRVLREAYDKGVTFFDTAEIYGPYTNEDLVGEALAPFRDHVVIATKFGLVSHSGGGPGVADSAPANIRAAVEGSLERLRTDRIDLYYQHRVDPKVPIEDVAGEIRNLIQEGKVMHFGLSEASGETIRRAHAVQAVSAVQTEYSFMERDPERNGVLEAVEELGVGFVPWGPVGMGYLTGKIDVRTTLNPETDLRSGFDRFSPENLAANMPIVDLLRRIAAKENATPAQVALAWLLAQKPWIVPIPGTRNVDHLNENLEAVSVQLSPADLAEIESAFSNIEVHGGRMNEMQMRMVDGAFGHTK
jgi:aryl-alcohol dehydrogenase-like predicted oxidoreductase